MTLLKDTHTIKPDGSVYTSNTTAMSGYTIIDAVSLRRALNIAKVCPFPDINGHLMHLN